MQRREEDDSWAGAETLRVERSMIYKPISLLKPGERLAYILICSVLLCYIDMKLYLKGMYELIDLNHSGYFAGFGVDGGRHGHFNIRYVMLAVSTGKQYDST
jgi:hypothetical protein